MANLNILLKKLYVLMLNLDGRGYASDAVNFSGQIAAAG